MSLASSFSLSLVLTVLLAAQPPVRSWASADEYDAGARALAEPNPHEKLALLQEWVSRFPKTQFERERLLAFSMAFHQIGDSRESLRRATQALSLDATDSSILMLIAAVGPRVSAPASGEIEIVASSALRLLSPVASPTPKPFAGSGSETTDAATSDPETRRVIDFVRRLRESGRISPAPNPELLKRQIAEDALAWVRTNTR